MFLLIILSGCATVRVGRGLHRHLAVKISVNPQIPRPPQATTTLQGISLEANVFYSNPSPKILHE
jgi:hypothetical protein